MNIRELQKLHQLSVKGDTLTAEENAALQNWYETLDREEDSILNNLQTEQNTQTLRENLNQTTKQIAKISREIETLVKQNENLRKENQSLKNALESRLVKKVA